MDLDQLSNMKYADLQKLAKEKLNITKRVSKVSFIKAFVLVLLSYFNIIFSFTLRRN